MKENIKKNLNQLKWLGIWSLIYAVLFWITDFLVIKIFSGVEFLNNYGIFYFLFVGILLAFLSKIIYMSIKRKEFRIKQDILFWILTFTFLIWLFQELFRIIIPNLTTLIWIILIKGFLLSFIIGFLRRMDFERGDNLKLPKISIGFIVAMGILVVTYYYSQSSHFLGYSLIYNIPPFVLWILGVVISLIIWVSIDG